MYILKLKNIFGRETGLEPVTTDLKDRSNS